jgi:surfeit locus 1 family protein
MTGQPEHRSGSVSQETAPRRRSFGMLLALAVSAALAFACFIALGTWQLQRLQWKRALIERVEQRIHAAPVPAPGPDQWAHISALSDEYRRVRITGTFLHSLTTKVKAVSELGSGYWLLTPLRSADGTLVLVNRGFIPADVAGKTQSNLQDERAQSTVTGLLRISEPGGAFLRRNDTAADRWYSRDVAAIAAARALPQVAPYFIDADADSSGGASGWPVGGLTVVAFQDNHLVYALTWYALALLVAGAAAWFVREERKLR